jgi:hypothetical protein
MPFETPAARAKWCTEHTAGTGHDRWNVYEQHRDPFPDPD